MKIKEWPPSILPPWKPVFRRSNRQQKEEGQRGISVRLGGGTHSPLSLLSHPIYLACRKPRVKHQFLPIHPFHLASSPAIVRVFSSLGSDHKPRDCFSAVTISKSSCTPLPAPTILVTPEFRFSHLIEKHTSRCGVITFQSSCGRERKQEHTGTYERIGLRGEPKKCSQA